MSTCLFNTEKVSISIVVFDTPDHELERCIISVFESILDYQSEFQDKSEFLLIVVNNGDRNFSQLEFRLQNNTLFRKSSCNFHFIEGHGNIGYGAGHNKAFLSALNDSGIHIYMNPDVFLGLKAISSGVRFLEENEDVVAVSPKCLDKDRKIQYLCKRYPSILDLFLRGIAPRIIAQFFESRLSRYEMRELNQLSHFIGVPIVSGCFIMCRSSALTNVSGFDQRYFLYFEDFDLSYRLKSEGELAYLSEMSIEHSGGNAAKKGFRHILMFSRSAIRFFNDYGWKWY